MDTNRAINYFKNGHFCSQAVIKTAIEEGLCPETFYSASTAFSGGMSSGCICGTLAAAQMIAGFCFPESAREISASIVEEFKKRNKVTCCRMLSAGLEGKAKKEHCSKYVSDVCEILNDLLKVKV